MTEVSDLSLTENGQNTEVKENIENLELVDTEESPVITKVEQ